jgi:hypothetical protein
VVNTFFYLPTVGDSPSAGLFLFSNHPQEVLLSIPEADILSSNSIAYTRVTITHANQLGKVSGTTCVSHFGLCGSQSLWCLDI